MRFIKFVQCVCVHDPLSYRQLVEMGADVRVQLRVLGWFGVEGFSMIVLLLDCAGMCAPEGRVAVPVTVLYILKSG